MRGIEIFLAGFTEMDMTYQNILKRIVEEVRQLPPSGKGADYIPELAHVDPDKFGVHLCTVNGARIGFGDHTEPFSIQSIVKVLSLALAFEQQGDALWARVGVEPSGSPFNSLWQLEYEHGIPRNPLINPGAIVVCDILCTMYQDPLTAFIDFVKEISGLTDIQVNYKVAASELEHGYRNMALINLMKACGNIQNNIDRVMSLYCQQCAIEMSCAELAQTFLFFANHGKRNDRQIISSSRTKRINAIMQVCGFYDEAGEFSFKVGLPGKSGVGGGIVAVHPGHYAVAVWSPRLNAKGNSVKGMEFLERLTTATGHSIF